MINEKLNNIFKGDKTIWIVFFFLCIISVVEVYSASAQLTYKAGDYLSPVIKHTGLLVVGVFCMVVTLNIKCRYFKIVTPFLLAIAFLLLIWVLIAGKDTNGAQRWVGFGFLSFQPSEIAKGAIVLATAQILAAMQTEKGADKQAFKYILTVCTIILLPIVFENLSTAALIFLVVLMMMLVGRVPLSQLGKLVGVIALFGLLGLTFVMITGDIEKNNELKSEMVAQADGEEAQQEKKKSIVDKVLHRSATWKSRIYKFASNGDLKPEEVDLDRDAQWAHANIAIAQSDVVGKGPGNSDQRDFLAQAYSDFIYAIIIEETGIEGAAIVALLYIILLYRTGRIASRCENNFPAFLAMGLALLLVTQALFNMCVAVGLAPVTGQPLPLISKGGTSSIINCIYMGVILSVSRSAKKKGVASAEQPALATATV